MNPEEEIRNKITNGFSIGRIPPKTREEFLLFSSEEYCDDRGMALKFLWDFYKGTMDNAYDSLSLEVESIKKDIENLREDILLLKGSEDNQPKEKLRKMLNGRMVNR